MGIATLTKEDQEALEQHGHVEFWEVARYGDDQSVTVECTRCGMVLLELFEKEHPWDNNEIQFARLLSELLANVPMKNLDKVCESMDLNESLLRELFERADKVWEAAKEKYCPPPKDSDER